MNSISDNEPKCTCTDPTHTGEYPNCPVHGQEDPQTRCIISGGEMLEVGAGSPDTSDEIPMPWEI